MMARSAFRLKLGNAVCGTLADQTVLRHRSCHCARVDGGHLVDTISQRIRGGIATD
jgi:hypothetical protein